MTVIHEKPTSPGKRFVTKVVDKSLYKGRPVKALCSKKSRKGGRNHYGRMTVRNIGGGHKKLYRHIDFKRDKDGVPGKVARFEYDPNRSCHIALIKYRDGEWRYILAPKKLKVGDEITNGDKAEIKPGNALAIESIPIGTTIHNVEMKPGKGGQLVRSAGGYAQLAAKEGTYATIRLRSGELRKVQLKCRATIGEVGNEEHSLRSLGKAGATRWRGRRPGVRGVAKNPIDHPHGGGEGKTSGGRHPVTPWGVPTKGYKTRRKKPSDKYIVRSRHQSKKV